MLGLATEFSEAKLINSYGFKEKSKPILLDVGANIGSFTHNFARQGWQVIAFEPVPDLIEKFEERNEPYHERVTLIKRAVSDVSGQIVPFYTSTKHPGIHTLKPFHDTHEAKLEVETIRLDEVVETHHLPHVTLLKVDIEGADFLALKGFDFEKFRPELVMIEFMDDRSLKNFDYTHHDVALYMDRRGYSTFVAEWEEIKEYYEPGKSVSHSFIQFAPYPLDHEPSWGNLIFVPKGDEQKIMQTYKQLKFDIQVDSIKKFVKKIPGAYSLYKLILHH